MSGILYLCATPIGNMEDMTFRAVKVLREVDLIAAEDTRNSRKLLDHYEIHTPMTSYHEHNKYDKACELIELLQSGKQIALISDAGMPGISDPGEVLAKMAHEAGIQVSVLPGACAAISAVAASGLPTDHFVFEGFLPRINKERKQRLTVLAQEKRTMIVYEAPHRIKKTLSDLEEVFGGEREISLCRELTKRYEEIRITTLAKLCACYEEKEAKGEFVLVIAGLSEQEAEKKEQAKWEGMDLETHMELYLAQGLDKKEAMKKVAADLGLTKRDIYSRLNRNGEK